MLAKNGQVTWHSIVVDETVSITGLGGYVISYNQHIVKLSRALVQLASSQVSMLQPFKYPTVTSLRLTSFLTNKWQLYHPYLYCHTSGRIQPVDILMVSCLKLFSNCKVSMFFEGELLIVRLVR